MRRMYDEKVIGCDNFLDMPATTRDLYMYLNLYADDEGFIDNAKKIIRMTGLSDEDLQNLIDKKYIKEIEEDENTKVFVLMDFFVNNKIRNHGAKGFKETIYKNARKKIVILDTGKYMDYEEYVASGLTEIKAPESIKKGFAKPTLEEVEEYCESRGSSVNPETFWNYYESNGWRLANHNLMRSWKSSIVTWENNQKQRREEAKPKIDYFKY